MQSPSAVRSAKDRLIVALDVPDVDEAKRLAEQLAEHVGMFKIGLELYAKHGPALFDAISEYGRPIFFDCKFHDIPNTVARASRQLIGKGIYMFNVHASGGATMMKTTAAAVREQAAAAGVEPPKMLAVTLLTSISDSVLNGELNWKMTADRLVERLARLASDCGMDGVVASPLEAEKIRNACGKQFLIVTPGVRPDWADKDDQARSATPAQALKNGADYIVVGRPITAGKNPADSARFIVDEMNAVR